MGMAYLAVLAGAALAAGACGSSQDPGKVPVDSPLSSYEAPDPMPGEERDAELFEDDAFDDPDDDGERDEHLEEGAGEDAADAGASKPSASEEGASAPNEEDAAEVPGGKGQAEADDAREARSESGS